MRNNNRNGKGYYIALILCAAAIGITSYVYYRNADQPEQAAIRETWEDVPVGTEAVEDIPVIATEPHGRVMPTEEPTRPEATVPAAKRTLKTAAPVAGAEIFGYSMEALSYNQTTRDWRVHNGVDLAAEAGSPVTAAADGEVYNVYEDDLLGHTVLIRHSDGYTTCYSSLSQDIAVAPGDKVTLGQTIGYAGDSAVAETTLGSHVHFSVSCYEKAMDPAEFLALGK